MRIRVFIKGPYFISVLLKRKITEKDVGKKADISPKHIRNVIYGRRGLSIDAANRIQRALPGVSYDDLFKIEMEESGASI